MHKKKLYGTNPKNVCDIYILIQTAKYATCTNHSDGRSWLCHVPEIDSYCDKTYSATDVCSCSTKSRNVIVACKQHIITVNTYVQHFPSVCHSGHICNSVYKHILLKMAYAWTTDHRTMVYTRLFWLESLAWSISWQRCIGKWFLLQNGTVSSIWGHCHSWQYRTITLCVSVLDNEVCPDAN